MIDPQELAKKAQSTFGQSKTDPKPRWKLLLEKVFFKNSPQRSYIEGGITVGFIMYWWFTKNTIPLVAWFFAVFALAIAGMLYWRKESKRLDAEIKRCDQEIKDIQKEIIERKDYFENIKKQLGEMMSKN